MNGLINHRISLGGKVTMMRFKNISKGASIGIAIQDRFLITFIGHLSMLPEASGLSIYIP
jgi:hypothetical protein